MKDYSENNRKALIHGLIKNSGVPLHTGKTHRLSKITRTPDNAEAIDEVIKFIDGLIVPPLLLIIGITGVGKTSLAYAAAWEFLESAFTVKYYQAEDLLNELQGSQEDSKRYGDIWRKLRMCDLLILDDIGAHNPTKWRDSQLDAIVDFRYRERAALIMTANKVDFSERITDRIKDGKTVIVRGKSHRGVEALS
jgi:DNA replication protein DnaC